MSEARTIIDHASPRPAESARGTPDVIGSLYVQRGNDGGDERINADEAHRMLRLNAPEPPQARSKPKPQAAPMAAPAHAAERERERAWNTPPAARAATANAATVANAGVPMKLAPKPARTLEIKQAGSQCRETEPSEDGRPVPLSRYVAGLASLPLRCPGHERVELALGEGARLHLLAREQSMRDLHAVRCWAHAHREIIAMACPQQQINFTRPIALHLFTSEPASVSDLHASDVLLHVLAPVEVAGRTGWYAAALNAPRP